MTRCRHSWRGLDTITAITRDVGDPFQYMYNALKHQVFGCKDSWDRIWDDTVLQIMANGLQTEMSIFMWSLSWTY